MEEYIKLPRMNKQEDYIQPEIASSKNQTSGFIIIARVSRSVALVPLTYALRGYKVVTETEAG